MEYGLLLQNIAKHIRLSADEEKYFLSGWQSKKLRRKQFLLQEGDVTKNAVFVVSGLLRMYSIDKNGFEHILQFAPPGWWIGDIKSFISQQPGSLYIDALEDSGILLMEKTYLDQLYKKVPSFERFFRILAENALGTYQQRLIDNLSLPAIERYNNFCRLYPSLIECLPQKQVASYIGVTPEFLSKMLSGKQTS
ncbi:MAG: Crp/Fnr family transcriptional regulator [Chitinophagaceae bacterium]|nr:Crp/Fnr family transcriptional regulator [Chitinophagaceae bacterium]